MRTPAWERWLGRVANLIQRHEALPAELTMCEGMAEWKNDLHEAYLLIQESEKVPEHTKQNIRMAEQAMAYWELVGDTEENERPGTQLSFADALGGVDG